MGSSQLNLSGDRYFNHCNFHNYPDFPMNEIERLTLLMIMAIGTAGIALPVVESKAEFILLVSLATIVVLTILATMTIVVTS